MASTSATRQLPTLSLEAAKIAAEGAEQKAKQMGIGRNLPTLRTDFNALILIAQLPQTSTSP